MSKQEEKDFWVELSFYCKAKSVNDAKRIANDWIARHNQDQEFDIWVENSAEMQVK